MLKFRYKLPLYVTGIIAIIVVAFFSTHSVRGEALVNETLSFTINSYYYSDDENYATLTVNTKNICTGYRIDSSEIVNYLKEGELVIGDTIMLESPCIIANHTLKYFKSSDKDIIESFKRKYML